MKLLAYSIRRILVAIPILLGVLTIVFLLARVAPGDPASAALGDFASKASVDALREKMGLNDPLYVQYGKYLYDIARGDLGESMISGRPVIEQVKDVLPYTLELTFTGVFIGSIIGVLLGIWTALKRNTAIDYAGRILSLAGLSLPAFFLAIILMYIFSIWLGILPAVGGGDLTDFKSNLTHLILPATAMAALMASYTTRMARSSVLNVLGEDYVRTARAKGLPESIVILKHAVRNALIPIVAVVGVYTVVMIGSSVMVEIVFARPGLGKLMVGAMKQRDYMTLQSVMVLYASFVVFINLLTDLAYGLIDPRIRYR
ncbi:ABC transporter permease [Chloroflexota bacterium]